MKKYHLIQCINKQYLHFKEVWCTNAETALESYYKQYPDAVDVLCEEVTKEVQNPFNVQIIFNEWS